MPRKRKESTNPPKLGKNPPAGAGRSAACRRCTDSGEVNLCSCLINCGHRLCTGEPAPGVIEPDYPVQNPRLNNNPGGLGGPRRKVRNSPATKPPRYDGPKGGK